MFERLKFLLHQIGERLWLKPLIMCLISLAGVYVARQVDRIGIGAKVPEISTESINSLLTIMSSSMLVIATFAVASMVSAYASASSTATPRSFPLIVADDVSQNALSAFIGSFIYSIVALIALQNGYFGQAGRFALFLFTMAVFGIVVLTFVRWVDSIARLGRLGTTIKKVEAATMAALEQRKSNPFLGGKPVLDESEADGIPLKTPSIGYIQRIDMSSLQSMAEEGDLQIVIHMLPGSFTTPHRALATVVGESEKISARELDLMAGAFVIGGSRTYYEDPRFGLVVLSEIASRALSPGINDAGSAIDVMGSMVRLFSKWGEPVAEGENSSIKFDRVFAPPLSLADMFEDAFSSIERDGAGVIEVMIRLLKTYEALASLGNQEMKEAAFFRCQQTLLRAKEALTSPQDLEKALQTGQFASQS